MAITTPPEVLTLTAPQQFSEEIKRSRFVVHAVPLGERDGISDALHAHCEPEANHNCWAWVFGEDYRYDDDGEPAGTAGRPILQAIQGHELDRVLVVVTRYFGGIKLGAGGLVRAYGGSASRCLDQASVGRLKAHIEITVTVAFDAAGILFHAAGKPGVRRGQEHYTQHGLSLRLQLLSEHYASFRASLNDQLRGQVQWQEHGEFLAPPV